MEIVVGEWFVFGDNGGDSGGDGVFFEMPIDDAVPVVVQFDR